MRSTSQLLKYTGTCIADKGQAVECDFCLWAGVPTNNESQNQTAMQSQPRLAPEQARPHRDVTARGRLVC